MTVPCLCSGFFASSLHGRGGKTKKRQGDGKSAAHVLLVGAPGMGAAERPSTVRRSGSTQNDVEGLREVRES